MDNPIMTLSLESIAGLASKSKGSIQNGKGKIRTE